jgi:phosphoglucosamine mutase
VKVASTSVPPRVAEEVARVTAELDGRGRVLVRPSGTEPVIRVLAELEDAEEARTLCGSIADLVRAEAGTS